MELVISYYGWHGAFQILSAIMANICVCGLLLRPVPAMSGVAISDPGDNTHKGKAADGEPASNIDHRDLSFSHHTPVRGTCFRFSKDVFKDLNLSLFCNVRFLLQVMVCGFLFACTQTFSIFIVPHAINVGITESEASFLMTSYGIGVILARISPISCLVDKKFMSASTLCEISFLVCGAAIILTAFVTSYVPLMIITVLCGLTYGIGGGLRAVITASCAPTKEEVSGAFAWWLTFIGIGSVVFMLITGRLI